MLISTLVLLLLISVGMNLFFINIRRIDIDNFKKMQKASTPLELPTPVLIDGDEHVHMWGKWEDTGKLDSTVIGAVMTVDGRLVLDYSGQKRYCTICGERQIQRPTQ